MLKPAFTINLNEKLLPGLVSVGKFDGLNPCIVAATSSDKVLLHNPLRRAQSSDTRGLPSAAGTDVTYLNINQTIRSLTVGQLKKDSNNDILVLGTPTSIQVYDVINNVDLFYRDIPDGANAVIVGTIGSIEEPIAIAGGNCAIQGFDETGNERYWTITGDNIVSLALADLDSDDTNELIVGSEDYDIRVFKEDTILMEINETDSVKCVCPIRDECFGYALSNGTVGVYFKKERLWRIKSKNQAICIAPFHLNGDGIPKLVTGWSNGKIDVRDVETGEIIFKDSLNHSVAGIMSSDYNMDGIVELIVCSVSGEVRGYVPACAVAGVPSSHVQPQSSAGPDLALEQEMIRDLMKRKQNLLLELRNYETSAMLAQNSEFPIHSKASTEDDQYGAIPADTQLKSSLILNTEDSKPHIQLSLQTTNETIIRFVVIFAEGIFKGESYVVHPAENEISGSLIVPLRPDKDAPVDLHVKSMVGYRGSYHYHVFELSRHLPRFSMYSLVLNPSESGKPKSFVRFTLTEKINKIVMWINRNFLLVSELDAQNELNLTFISLRDGKQLVLEMADKSNELTIKTENIELAGSIIQSLAADFCGITNLRSMSDFPKEIEQLKKMIQKVEELQTVRQQLSSDIAENSVNVRALIVRAEDARLLGEWKMVKQLYMDLNNSNRELLHEYQIRSQNYRDMVESLRKMNMIIQKFANLRIGPPKAELIQLCRGLIKQNNLKALSRVLSSSE